MKTTTNIPCPAIALFALACFALSPTARAVLPAPDGGYPGQNTAEGDDALFSLTTGVSNTAIGFDALYSNTGGFGNTAVGASALRGNIWGIDNTALGEGALGSNTNGFGNVAIGFSALLLSTADENTAIGFGALGLNTIGNQNVAIGFAVLGSNTTGYGNTAIGYDALITNSTGSNNTVNGAFVLSNNISGDDNTATGFDALSGNTTGNNNTANGFDALSGNTAGNNNTANGLDALVSNRAGNGNTASGVLALSDNTAGDNNTATGHNALSSNTTGSFNVALGAEAGGNLTTGGNNIDIANRGVAGEADTIRIGTRERHTNTFIAGISGVTVAGGVEVIVDAKGHLGTVVSSERFKDGIKPMDKASEAILALKPVTFHYKHQLDPEGISQFGLVAEEVEKVNPDLVARDEQGKPYTVRYDAVNAMLLNEFIKEHRKVEDLKKDFRAIMAQQQKEIAALAASVKDQAAQIQKVSAQFEASKPAPQVVDDP